MSTAASCDFDLTHYQRVTRRLIKGLFVNLAGWPERSPIWSSTMQAFRVLQVCHRRLTPKYRELVAEAAVSKRVHHLRSPRDVRAFLEAIEYEQLSSDAVHPYCDSR